MNSIAINCLIVDDLEENLLSLEALLRMDGVTILKASSGEQALEMLLKHDVALAFLDVQMPNMDGFELAELMRNREKTRNIPIIFVTAGHEDRQRRFQGYQAGAVDFLQKPIESDILKSKATIFFELYRQKILLQKQRDELKIYADENLKLLKTSQSYAKALKEADHRKDEFLATLAHELRNPLAPIRNGIHLISKSKDEGVVTELCDMMNQQVTHLVRLIDDLLDVSRVSLGKIVLTKVNVSLEEAVKSAVEMSEQCFKAKDHKLTIHLPDEALFVYADFTRLTQVIINLLNNACKYTDDGGEILLNVYSDHDQVVIEVTDNGIGIAENMLTKVFEVFTQVDFSSNHSQGGLGIGLALVKRIVKMHDGQIEAMSKGEGKGSTFKLFLPTIKNVPNTVKVFSEPETKNKDKSPSRSLTILVVDDNKESAKTLAEIIELYGHTVRVAYDGQQALSLAPSILPDVILLDIGLPDIDGFEICRIFRDNSDLDNTVIVAQTGWGQEKDKALAESVGFNEHLVKPLSIKDINAVLDKFD